MNDGLICGTCKGEKVVRTPVSNYTKVYICPLCKGTGRVVSESEQERNKGKRLIKGQWG